MSHPSAFGDAALCQRERQWPVGAGNRGAKTSSTRPQGFRLFIVKSRRANMVPTTTRLLPVGLVAALLAACGGGGGGNSGVTPTMPAAQTGNVAMMISDASTEDWATIGVKVQAIALIPQGGGTNVTVY